MDRLQALHNFWSSFSLKAYDENTVSETAALPYITYNVVEGYFENSVAMTASLWYRTKSWAAISQKADEIGAAIGYGGKLTKADDCTLWIKRGMPFSQRVSDEDDTIRRILINIEVEFLRI